MLDNYPFIRFLKLCHKMYSSSFKPQYDLIHNRILVIKLANIPQQLKEMNLRYITNEQLNSATLINKFLTKTFNTINLYESIQKGKNICNSYGQVIKYVKAYRLFSRYKYLQFKNRDLYSLYEQIINLPRLQALPQGYLNDCDENKCVFQQYDLICQIQAQSIPPCNYVTIYDTLEMLQYQLLYGDTLPILQSQGIQNATLCHEKLRFILNFNKNLHIINQFTPNLFINSENRLQKIILDHNNFLIAFERHSGNFQISFDFQNQQNFTFLSSELHQNMKLYIAMETKIFNFNQVGDYPVSYLQYINNGFTSFSLHLAHPRLLISLTVQNVHLSNLDECTALKSLWTQQTQLYAVKLKKLTKLQRLCSENDEFIGEEESKTFVQLLSKGILPAVQRLEVHAMQGFQEQGDILIRAISYIYVAFTNDEEANIILLRAFTQTTHFCEVVNGCIIDLDELFTENVTKHIFQRLNVDNFHISHQNYLQYTQKHKKLSTNYLVQDQQPVEKTFFTQLNDSDDICTDLNTYQQQLDVKQIYDVKDYQIPVPTLQNDLSRLLQRLVRIEFQYQSLNQLHYSIDKFYLQFLAQRLLLAAMLEKLEAGRQLFNQDITDCEQEQYIISIIAAIKRFPRLIWKEKQIFNFQLQLTHYSRHTSLYITYASIKQLQEISNDAWRGIFNSPQLIHITITRQNFIVLNNIANNQVYQTENIDYLQEISTELECAGQSQSQEFNLLLCSTQKYTLSTIGLNITCLYLIGVHTQFSLFFPESLQKLSIDSARLSNLHDCINLTSFLSRHNTYNFFDIQNLAQLQHFYSENDIFQGADGSGESCMLKFLLIKAKLVHICVIGGQNITISGIYIKNLEQLEFFYVQVDEEESDKFKQQFNISEIQRKLRQFQIIETRQELQNITEPLGKQLFNFTGESVDEHSSINVHLIFNKQYSYSKLKVATIVIGNSSYVPNMYILHDRNL